MSVGYNMAKKISNSVKDKETVLINSKKPVKKPDPQLIKQRKKGD
jgi:hypothetical protein